MKLFCFPYAGGSAMNYKKWIKYLPEQILVHPVELAGRGIRYKEACMTEFDQVIEDVYQFIIPQLDSPFAFFGHSMGALIAYELAKKLKRDNNILPVHLFLSGRGAPSSEVGIKYSQMGLPELLKELKKLGGITERFFEDETTRQIFIPILIDDFKVCESYRYVKEGSILECDFSILNGKQDHTMKSKDIIGWKSYCKCQCKIKNFEGDHFYINNCTEQVVNEVKQVLLSKMIL